MDFYIGNSIENIDIKKNNVRFSDDLIQYIYNQRLKTDYDLSKLYSIDPYKDVVISNEDILGILQICNFILDSSIMDAYGIEDDGELEIKALAELMQAALKTGDSIVSIGD